MPSLHSPLFSPSPSASSVVTLLVFIVGITAVPLIIIIALLPRCLSFSPSTTSFYLHADEGSQGNAPGLSEPGVASLSGECEVSPTASGSSKAKSDDPISHQGASHAWARWGGKVPSLQKETIPGPLPYRSGNWAHNSDKIKFIWPGSDAAGLKRLRYSVR